MRAPYKQAPARWCDLNRRLCPRLHQRPTKSRVLVKAAMGDVPSVLDTLITYGALSLSVGATVYTVFYNWPRRRADKQAVSLTQPADNFTWGVMGAVSAFPLFNYMVSPTHMYLYTLQHTNGAARLFLLENLPARSMHCSCAWICDRSVGVAAGALSLLPLYSTLL